MSKSTELLISLIREKPVSCDLAAVNRVSGRLRDFLTSHGIYCVQEEINGCQTLFASTTPGKSHDYLLCAHVDVVPASTENQFEPYEKDGILYGRGTSDCLGCAVCIAETLASLKGKADVCAVFSADEEIGGYTTQGMIERGYRATRAIIVVDADWASIVVAQKGILVLDLIARSKGGHSSAPWQFDNAIEKLCSGFTKLRAQWKNPSADDRWHDSMTPCIISGGSANNQIPDMAEMTLNIRYTVPGDRERIINFVRDASGLEVRESYHTPPVIVSTDSPELERFRRVYAKKLNCDIPFVRMDGATDIRHFAAIGVPMMVIGLAGSGMHSANEFLPLDSIGIMHDILLDYLTPDTKGNNP